MKKFGLFISIALLTAFVGCDSDDVEDPVVPAVSKPVVAVSENTPTSFGVEWDAVDEAAGYQYVVTESDAAGNTSEFCPETQTDKTSLRFDDAAAGAKYTVKVKALAAADSQLADSEYAEIFVETPAEGLSSQTFAFTVDPVGYDSATVKVEPSIADETYFFAVVKSSLLLDKNSNAIIEMLKKDIEPESLGKGEQTIEAKWLDPETAYVAVAFGYDADRGASTSVLSRSEKFSTAGDPRMSIDVSVMNAGDEAISAKCVPSGSGSYFVTAVKSADVAGMSDREIRRSIRDQVLKVFFIPLLGAGLHIAFAFHIIKLMIKGTKKCKQAYLWYRLTGVGPPMIAFHFSPSLSRNVAESLLGNYSGTIIRDSYAAYEKLDCEVACCWAHVRRRFPQGVESGYTKAEPPLKIIHALYQIERVAKERAEKKGTETAP